LFLDLEFKKLYEIYDNFFENTSLELKGTTSYTELILACNQVKIGYTPAQ